MTNEDENIVLEESNLSESENELTMVQFQCSKTLSLDSEVSQYSNIALTCNSNSQSSISEHLDISGFDPKWVTFIGKFDTGFNKDWFTVNRKPWLIYYPNHEYPLLSKYACRWCQKYASSVTKSVKHLSDLSKPDGFRANSLDENARKLLNHERGVHKLIYENLIKKQKITMSEYVGETKNRRDILLNKKYEVTARVMMTVYTTVFKDMSLQAHEALIKLQKIHGLNMGIHHFEHTSATRMMKAMSKDFHATLVQHLSNEKIGPISIILDSSVDNSGENKLIVYIRALENNSPKLYFYRLLLIEGSETAEALFELLKKALIEDKLEESIRKNLVGFGSDGASVMLGRKSGLAQRFKTYVNGPLYVIHCMAHRLHLASRKIFEEIELKNFENLVNKVYAFYSRSAKKLSSLRTTAEALEVKFYKLDYIHEIRWISSEYIALQKLYKNWESIIVNMENVQSEASDFDEESKQKARSFLISMKSPRFFTTLIFLLDGLERLHLFSKVLQEKLGVVIGKEVDRSSLLQSIKNLRNNDGTYVTIFLTEARCFKDLSWKKCLKRDLEISDIKVRFKDIVLEAPAISVRGASSYKFLSLEKLKRLFTDIITQELESYFPEGELQMFNALEPNKLPISKSDAIDFEKLSILQMNNFFKFGESESILQQWAQLLLKLTDDQKELCDWKSVMDIPKFWQHFLNKESLNWNAEMKKLVQTSLVIPIGSADAERGFAIMNNLKTSQRSRLDHNTLEAALRLKINGPPLEKFDSLHYAVNWINKHNGMRSDDPSLRGKQRPDDYDDKKYFDRSQLF